MDTTQLVLRVQNGDGQALDELYYHTYRRAYSVALMMIKSEVDAYDIMQAAYLDAFAALNTLADKSAFIPWFNGIAAAKCRDFLQNQLQLEFFSSQTTAADNSALYSEADYSKEFYPKDGVSYEQAKTLAAGVLDSMPPDNKLVLLLRCVLRMSAADIAASLGQNEEVIAQALNTAESYLTGQGELMRQNGSFPVSDNEIIPFYIWMFNEVANNAPVHEMSPEVRKAALNPAVSSEQSGETPTPEIPSQTTERIYPQTAPVLENHPLTRPYSYDDNFSGTQPKQPEKKKHTVRIIVIAAASVLVLLLGALAFVAFALPNITGENNAISNMVGSTKVKQGRTPQELVTAFEKAFNDGNREEIAKLYLPDQSVKSNLKGGVFQIMQSVSDYASGQKISIECELMDDLTYDGDSATGTVRIIATLPTINGIDLNALGKPTYTINATFEKYKDGDWYFKEF